MMTPGAMGLLIQPSGNCSVFVKTLTKAAASRSIFSVSCTSSVRLCRRTTLRPRRGCAAPLTKAWSLRSWFSVRCMRWGLL